MKKREEIESLDQKNKWTVSLYPGGGAWLISLEVTAEHEEEALENAIKKIYNQKKFDNPYFISVEEALSEENEKWYEKEFKEYKKKNKNDDFGDFLSNYCNYLYMDIEDVGPLYIVHTEHLRIEEKWGLYNDAYKENEDLL